MSCPLFNNASAPRTQILICLRILGSNQGLLLWQSALLTSRHHGDPLYSTDTGNHMLELELDLQSLFGLLSTTVLIGWDPPYPLIWAYIRGPYWQCCGTVTIYNGSGSGSDLWKVLVPVPTFEKFWFRFRFQLLKSYGSGSYFEKVTVPVLVPVPAPYLKHKKQIFPK